MYRYSHSTFQNVKQPREETGLNLLNGLDDLKDKEWLSDIKQYNDHMVRSTYISYPCFPLVKNKRLRIEVLLVTGEIYFVFERKLGSTTTGIRLSTAEYQKLQEKFPLIQDLVKANQMLNENREAVQEVLEGRGEILNELYGWKYCRLPLLNDILLTFKWHEGKHFTLVKIHRGLVAESGTWVPDSTQEICLGAGGMEYLMRHLNKNVLNSIDMWKSVFRVTNPCFCLYSFIEEEDETEKAVKSITTNSGDEDTWDI